jgi:hypothetical protein
MSRELVQTAAKLLAKAQSTESDFEAIALVERSYSLLAQAINIYDLENDSGAGWRRRERRRLRERRRRRSEAVDGTGAGLLTSDFVTDDSIARYRRTAADGGSSRRRRIDTTL